MLDALAPGGAWFFRQLADQVGAKTDAALSAAPVGPRLGGPDQQRHPHAAARAHPQRHAQPPHPPAPAAAGPATGRRAGPHRPAGDRRPVGAAAPGRHRPHPPGARAYAERLLDRHGVVTRGAVMSERVPGGFAAVYKVLSAFEDSGRCRRGYFVAGLGAAQFGTAGAVDRLRTFAEVGRRQAERRGARRHRPGQPVRRRAALAGLRRAATGPAARPARSSSWSTAR